ncbi:hypothetical protein AAY473_037625 [Plecturocebus cupreus]
MSLSPPPPVPTLSPESHSVAQADCSSMILVHCKFCLLGSRSCFVSQAVVQWDNHGSLQSPPPGLNQSSHHSMPNGTAETSEGKGNWNICVHREPNRLQGSQLCGIRGPAAHPGSQASSQCPSFFICKMEITQSVFAELAKQTSLPSGARRACSEVSRDVLQRMNPQETHRDSLKLTTGGGLLPSYLVGTGQDHHPRLPYHCCPGHLRNPGVGHCYVDNEEEDAIVTQPFTTADEYDHPQSQTNATHGLMEDFIKEKQTDLNCRSAYNMPGFLLSGPKDSGIQTEQILLVQN